MDSLIGLLYRRHITTFMLFVAVGIFGLISIPRLPISLMPPSNSPAITILTRYPGISPSKIEEIITKPIEEQISGVGGIEDILSSSEEGESRINVIFKPGTKISYRSLEVRSKIDLIRGNFPREVEEPAILRYDPTNKPIFIVKLESERYKLKELREFGENKYKKKFERIDGVSEIHVGGGFQREINIDIDKGKLLQTGVGLEEVLSKIRTANVDVPAGNLLIGDNYINIRVIGKLIQIKEIGKIPITVGKSEQIVYLSDISNVKDGFKEKEDIARDAGKEVVSIYVQKAGDANSLALCEELRKELSSIHIEGIQQSINYDQSQTIKTAIAKVADSAISGGIIAVVVLFLFLRNFYATILVSVSIPLSIISTFGLMYFFNVGINVISLCGLALGVGMLVDCSVVVIDRIFFVHQENGFVEDGILKASSGLSKELFASVLTSIAVFFPIFFSSRELRDLYGGLAITVSASLVTSLIVSLTFLPTLAKFILTKESRFKTLVPPQYVLRYISKMKSYIEVGTYYKILSWLRNKILRRQTNLNPESPDPHELLQFDLIKSLKFLLKHYKKTALYSTAIIVVCFCLSYFLKQEYIDPTDSNEISASLEVETGTHLDATDLITKSVERVIENNPNVEKVSSKVEKWHSDLMIKLKPASSREGKSANDVITELKKETDELKNAFVFYTESGAGEGSKEIDIEIIGDEAERIKELARESAKEVGGIPGIQQVALRFKEGKDQITFSIDKVKASQSGLLPNQIANFMKTAYTGSIPTKFYDKDKEIDIRVRFSEEDRKGPKSVFGVAISSSQSEKIAKTPLIELSSIKKEKAESRIYRKNKRRTYGLTAKLGDIDTGSAVIKIETALKKISFPENYHYEMTGNYKKLKESKTEMFNLIILAFIIIVCILSSLFESFLLPFLIILTIPFSAAGVILILFVCRMSLNISVYIGFVMLAGITVNNSILIVETFLEKLKSNQYYEIDELLTEGIRERIRPILITTITTVLGLLPSVLDSGEGSQLWRPLAVTVVAGLSISTALTVFLFPAFFKIAVPYLLEDHKSIPLQNKIKKRSKKI
ncbi:efflux RND transporter permease subunit [Leptospira borgpetersenii]|uniref:efflux RND transporter permease subunit n=1 Tax=Leptospira borgpetersenii TaxID=174 RepID=UPI00188AB242|nr:efflux RND transporter permease subunit [Leptospira borgpetersenii]MBF3377017.1 efflux RND transporter permease subunit [Leptospira borgpetersenii serovar Balcanica]